MRMTHENIWETISVFFNPLFRRFITAEYAPFFLQDVFSIALDMANLLDHTGGKTFFAVVKLNADGEMFAEFFTPNHFTLEFEVTGNAGHGDADRFADRNRLFGNKGQASFTDIERLVSLGRVVGFNVYAQGNVGGVPDKISHKSASCVIESRKRGVVCDNRSLVYPDGFGSFLYKFFVF